MLFKRYLLEKILSGEKTQTRRPIKRKKGRAIWEVGKQVGVRNGYKPFVAYVTIKRRYRQKLGQITDKDARKEGFANVDEFKQAWIQIYGNWKPNEIIWVYDFELAKRKKVKVQTLK